VPKPSPPPPTPAPPGAVYTTQRVVSSSFVIAGSISDFTEDVKNDIASRIAVAAGVDVTEVVITAASGSVTLTVDILTTSSTPTEVMGALGSSFSSAAALSELLGPSVSVEAIASAPQDTTKLVMTIPSPGAPPPPSPAGLSSVQAIAFIGAPVIAVVLIIGGLVVMRRRQRKKGALSPTDAVRASTGSAALDDGEAAGRRDFAAAPIFERAERQRAEKLAAAKAAEEKAATEKAEAERLAAEQAAAKKAAEDAAEAERLAIALAAAEKAAVEKAEADRIAAEHAAIVKAAQEKLEKEAAAFWNSTGSPDHRELPKVISSKTRNGVNDARAELERLWQFVGMSPRRESSPSPTGRLSTSADPAPRRQSQTERPPLPATPPPYHQDPAIDPFTA